MAALPLEPTDHPYYRNTKVTSLSVTDVRYPTSLFADGSDAMHTDPDYSCAYVVLQTDHPDGHEGHGLTFTLGKGTNVVIAAVNALEHLVVDRNVHGIFANFAAFYRTISSESQIRWIGPEKGALHLATAAVLNALWDLWAKLEGKPLWKLIVDLQPEQIISAIDFRYIRDALTENEALTILREGQTGKQDRVREMEKNGYPAYSTSCGWLGYESDLLRKKLRTFIRAGWTRFKVKVGGSLDDDIRRLTIVREEIGYDKLLMVDANQKWDVPEAISWMQQLARFKPLWIEEPTSPDDVLGHAAVAKALAPLGIGVATGEQCANRVIFKQLLQASAISYCQIDTCRLGSINEILAVLLMACKFGVPVCPHAGGVGLCELAQHMAFIDYIVISKSLDNRVLEYVEHLHEHFAAPVTMKEQNYVPPTAPGYLVGMLPSSIAKYQFPNGPVWKDLMQHKAKPV
ncbi:mitochondrial enolase superfamily member 1-like [Paramacrobiotus metropolitanus]|uniref:mitochondrial enolase superfamily member 1-like n=1 Tax=Paramacrobiotus metropolitanus TaxID=2943436 RepID=UPI0024456045|nr:mitochondrial enolase superfamily member 1-like [Paramacrobiotus metropolitanus]